MSMFGSLGPFVTWVAVGAVVMMCTWRFMRPTRSHMHFIGFAVGMLVSLALIGGAFVQFFNPDPPAPARVAPVAAPGASPYVGNPAASAAPNPYAPAAKP